LRTTTCDALIVPSGSLPDDKVQPHDGVALADDVGVEDVAFLTDAHLQELLQARAHVHEERVGVDKCPDLLVARLLVRLNKA